MGGAEARVGLLRGINVGGHNRLPMASLVEIYASLGATDVRTYIQSGNVVYRAAPAVAGGLSARVTEAIGAKHRFKPPIVERSAAELAAVVASNPFLAEDAAGTKLHVVFLDAEPDPATFAALPRGRDRFELRGRDVYLACPEGMGKTDLPDFGKVLRCVATARNWRTTLTLLEMCRAAG